YTISSPFSKGDINLLPPSPLLFLLIFILITLAAPLVRYFIPNIVPYVPINTPALIGNDALAKPETLNANEPAPAVIIPSIVWLTILKPLAISAGAAII